MNLRFALLSLGLLLPITACADHNGGISGLVIGTAPLFEVRSEIATDTQGHADFAVARLNGDAFLDMAVVALDGSVQIMLGANGGTFSKGQTLMLAGAPVWVAAADLDGDGDIDLAVVRTESNQTSILLNNGQAEFTVGQVLPTGRGALAVVIADANDDGILDVIVAQLPSPQVVVYRNNGLATFTVAPGLLLPGGGTPFNMAVGDVNHDQAKDLVVCDSSGDRILIYFGNQSGDFDPVPAQFPCGGAPKGVSIGDLTRDGNVDLVISAFDDNKIQVFTDYLGGKGTSYFDINLNGPPSVTTIGDVTGDGLLDLVACLGARASMLVVPGDASESAGGTGLGAPFQLDASGLPLRPFIGDVNNDGKNDLLVLSGLFDRVNLWLAKSDGRLAGARNYDSGQPSAESVAGADFDGDGRFDAMVGGPAAGEVSVMVAGQPSGALAIARRFTVGAVVYRVTAADLDRDGRMDAVLSCGGGLKLLRNRSTPGNFDFEVLPDAGTGLINIGQGPFGVAVADMDRDGNLDLLVADFIAGGLHQLRGTAAPFVFGQDIVFQLGGGPVDVVAADFTADGIIDAAASRSGAADIAVLKNDGRGNLTMLANLPVNVAPNYLITGDFDRDGRADLVVSNGATSTVQVLFARLVGFDIASFPAGRTPTALLARDLTGDGVSDILVASLVGGDFRVLVGDGRGGFPTIFGFPGTLGATSAVLQDVTGDGQPDLLIGSIITNRVSVVVNITR